MWTKTKGKLYHLRTVFVALTRNCSLVWSQDILAKNMLTLLYQVKLNQWILSPLAFGRHTRGYCRRPWGGFCIFFLQNKIAEKLCAAYTNRVVKQLTLLCTALTAVDGLLQVILLLNAMFSLAEPHINLGKCLTPAFIIHAFRELKPFLHCQIKIGIWKVVLAIN